MLGPHGRKVVQLPLQVADADASPSGREIDATAALRPEICKDRV